MFAIIYRSYLKPGRELEFQESWKTVAQYFVKERGALGSSLHKTSEGMWVAYSRWPDRQTRDASWPQEDDEVSPELPTEVQQAIVLLKACMDQGRKLPDICTDVICEIFNT